MADPALTSDPLERYGAIEKAYCDERWGVVIQDGQTLLLELPRTDPAPPEGLKERLELLMAHAYLYGFGERDSAEDLYQAVLRSGAEATLRQIAEQGLQQCTLPVASAAVDTPQPEASSLSPQPQPVTADGEAFETPSAAAPEPAAPAAAPGSAESGGDSWGSASATASVEPQGDALGWLAPVGVGDTAAPRVPNSQPVMPWLTQNAPPATRSQAASAAPGIEAVSDAMAAASAAEPPEAQSGPMADDDSSAMAAPPLAPAGVAAESTPERPDSLQAAVVAAVATLQSGDGGSSAEPQAAAPGREELLIPDVIEEPELIELHQTEQLRREDVELSVREALPAAAAVVDTILDQDLDQGVAPPIQDRRTSEIALIPPEPVLPSRPEPGPVETGVREGSIDPSFEEDATPAAGEPAPGIVVVSGLGPFGRPPQPVAEEDPEMLMGLLTVELG